ncbi:hypothetical protein [Planococcus sp. YIM B11945]|uniref:hypothetical protein n=1 Tax=Planococcus sp. YIM B11945 TaxID=3435410 RepID=UPI003D7E66BB
MSTVALIIFLFFIPYAWFVWSSLSVKSGKIGKPHWKIVLAAFAALVLGSFVFNYYISNAYQLSFFQNGFESTVALIVTAAFLLVIVIVNVIVSKIFKGAPKSFHNPKVVWMITAVLCTTILFFTMWVYPLAEKTSYVQKVEHALTAAEQQQTDEEITVVFMSSEKNCFRATSSNCNNVTYKNAFFLKNNLDIQKEVQVRIRALDAKQNELKEVESDVMTLGPGELKLVETEETSDQASIWSRSSFETESRTQSYESLYRFRDAK